MPEMDLKETIEILKEIATSIELTDKGVEALTFAISKLSLLEQVEKCGVEKKEPHWISTGQGSYDENASFNSAIDLCNARLVKKLEGIWGIIQDTILSYQVNEASISCQYLKDNPKSLIDCLAQAIRTHLTKKEE